MGARLVPDGVAGDLHRGHPPCLAHVGQSRARAHGHEQAVAGVGLGPLGTAMVEVAQALERHLDERSTLAALHVDHESDTAGVVFEARVVEPAGFRQVLEIRRAGMVRARAGLRRRIASVQERVHAVGLLTVSLIGFSLRRNQPRKWTLIILTFEGGIRLVALAYLGIAAWRLA